MSTLVDMWRATVARCGAELAVVTPAARVTWSTLDCGAQRVAVWLRHHGLQPGDRVVLQLPNSAEYIAAYFGILLAGGVAVGLHPGLLPEELERLIAHSESRCVITTPDQWPMSHSGTGVSVLDCTPNGQLQFGTGEMGEETFEPDTPALPGALAQIIYTSGTTGRPKGVCLTHSALVANTRAIVACLGLTDKDIGLGALPFVYSYGNSVLLTHVSVGARLVLPHDMVFWNRTLDLLQRETVTGFSGVPATFAMLLEKSNFASRQFPALRYVTCAGGALPEELFHRLREILPHVGIHLMYGQTEAGARLSMLPPADVGDRPRSIGRGLPGVTLQVVDPQGAVVGGTDVGELVAQGPNLMQGYWKDPELTRQVLRDGWLHTGDLACRDEQGYLFIVGRRVDMIKVGSYRVAPSELEEILTGCPGVAEVAVVGLPDPIWGQVPVAFVVPRQSLDPPVSADAVLEYVSGKVPVFKRLRAVNLVPTLPRTLNGKINRLKLMGLESTPGPMVSENPTER
ncbi:MAG: class I adenylate-forming enzyme family protein [Planctomycetaceae bacterium]|jgi:acyl-CoA synthetase (AMP-forming)/AMP-acid ligase II